MQIKALKWMDHDFGAEWRNKVNNRWVYDDFKQDENWRKKWISFDCALYNPDDNRVYCGITSFDSDIFRAYDRERGVFIDLGVKNSFDEYDAKFHRALLKGADGCIYAAIAQLHCIDHYADAPGGAIVRYDPQRSALEKLGIPIPHFYIQNLAIDETRKTAYGIGFYPQALMGFDLIKKTGQTLGYINSVGTGGVLSENIVLDDAGCVWSNWSLLRAWAYETGPDSIRLCCYDPQKKAMRYFQKGLPRPDGSYGTTLVESFHNFHDGFLYAGGGNGSFYRIDPETANAEKLFSPITDRPSRLSSLAVGADGAAYGVTGKQGRCEVIRIDYKRASYELLGAVKETTGAAMWQCHDIVHAGKNVFYACENDNPQRSSYLWEIAL